MNSHRIKTVAVVFVACLALCTFFKSNTKEMVAGFRKSDLLEVLKATEVAYDGAFADLVKQTQAKWLGAANKEWWELKKIHEDKRDLLLPVFRRMWLVDEWINQYFTYKYILFMGSEICKQMEERLVHLQKLLAVPVHTDALVFLSSDRLLAPHEQEFLRTKGWCDLTTEQQALDRMCKSQGLGSEKIVWIQTPYTFQQNACNWRPTTADTVTRWLKMHPYLQPGRVLVVSYQPFCYYQQMVVETLLPKGFTVKTVGLKADPETPVAKYLDTLARILYVWHTGKDAF